MTSIPVTQSPGIDSRNSSYDSQVISLWFFPVDSPARQYGFHLGTDWELAKKLAVSYTVSGFLVIERDGQSEKFNGETWEIIPPLFSNGGERLSFLSKHWN